MMQTRIRLLSGAITVVALTISLGLSWVMGVEHDDWLERSYGNRWAFRDVPSRRGAITDRRGRVLRVDRPGVDLEFRYWAFRRQHPLGVALHAANLVLEAKGIDRRFGYLNPRDLLRACKLLLALPCDLLSTDPFSREQARDLRFYTYSLLRSLTGLSSRQIIPPLLEAVRQGENTSLLDVLRRSLAEKTPAVVLETEPLVVFQKRLDELQDLGRRIAEFEGLRSGVDNLWTFLQKRMALSDSWRALVELPRKERDALVADGFKGFLASSQGPAASLTRWQDWPELELEERERLVEEFNDQRESEDPDETSVASRFDTPPDEARPITLVQRIPYEQALWFGMQRELHPGWRLRPSVERAKGEAGTLGSLGSLVGRVTASWRTDGREVIDDRVWRTLSTDLAIELDAELGSLPQPLETSLRDSRSATVRNYYRRSGRVGRSGIEQSMDDLLSGQPGLRLVERDRRSKEHQMFQSMDVALGKDVEMSIDVDLQRVLESVLQSPQWADSPELAMAVIDPQSGDILALGARTRGKDGEPQQWSVGATMPRGNHIVGSVVKPFVLLEHLDALRNGRQARDHNGFLECQRVYQRDVRGSIKKLECDGVHGDGARDPVRALAQSCNIFFFQTVEGLGAEGLRRALARVGWHQDKEQAFGFAEASFQKSVVGLPGRINASPALRPNQFVLQMQGIGYGVEVNALQVARAYAGLATGTLPRLSLVKGAARPGVPLLVDPRDLAVVRSGLRSCVLEGTARRITGLRDGGLAVYGKTGTGEVSDKHDRNNAWFAGFVGTEDKASLAFAAVAYDVAGHGADVGGQMVAEFLQRAAQSGLSELYLEK